MNSIEENAGREELKRVVREVLLEVLKQLGIADNQSAIKIFEESASGDYETLKKFIDDLVVARIVGFYQPVTAPAYASRREVICEEIIRLLRRKYEITDIVFPQLDERFKRGELKEENYKRLKRVLSKELESLEKKLKSLIIG